MWKDVRTGSHVARISHRAPAPLFSADELDIISMHTPIPDDVLLPIVAAKFRESMLEHHSSSCRDSCLPAFSLCADEAISMIMKSALKHTHINKKLYDQLLPTIRPLDDVSVIVRVARSKSECLDFMRCVRLIDQLETQSGFAAAAPFIMYIARFIRESESFIQIYQSSHIIIKFKCSSSLLILSEMIYKKALPTVESRIVSSLRRWINNSDIFDALNSFTSDSRISSSLVSSFRKIHKHSLSDLYMSLLNILSI